MVLAATLVNQVAPLARLLSVRQCVTDHRFQAAGSDSQQMLRFTSVDKNRLIEQVGHLDRFVKADDAADNEALAVRLKAIAAMLDGIAVTLVPAAKTGRVPVLEIAVPDALALSARLQRGDPAVHLSERHAARGVLTLDPQVLLPEHDAPLAAAIRTQFKIAG